MPRSKVWLARHGEAVAGPVDDQRALSATGKQEVEAVARTLARSGKVRPTAVIHSGKVRARETAEILAAALGVTTLEQADGLAPQAEASVWAERLGTRSEVMLVGHLPHMEGLVARLVGNPDEPVVRMVTGSVVCLTREEGQPTWSITWMVSPSVAG